MQDKKVLITGVTGQVGFPFALHHAAKNEVWAIARFGDQSKRKKLEQAGAHCRVVDLEAGEFGDLPRDFDYIFHFAVAKPQTVDFDQELRGNAEATGRLMSWCRDAGAFFHCSTTGVYEVAEDTVFREDSPLGDNHRVMMPTYSIGKIATEAVVRFCAREFDLPTVICRLNTPYGEQGWPFYHLQMMQHGVEIPLRENDACAYTMIHQDDINRLAPQMMQAAAVPASIYNFCGQEHVRISEWCGYIAGLTGLEPKYRITPDALASVMADNSKMRSVVGPAQVHWKDGIRAMVEAAGMLREQTSS